MASSNSIFGMPFIYIGEIRAYDQGFQRFRIIDKFCTGCDLVFFRSTSKLHNICVANFSNKIFTFLKSHTFALIMFVISFWFNNYEYGFGGKIQKSFLTPSAQSTKNANFQACLLKKVWELYTNWNCTNLMSKWKLFSHIFALNSRNLSNKCYFE